MLVRPHDGCIDHGVFIVRIIRQGLEKTLPYTTLGPAGKTCVGVFPSAKTLRQIALWCAGPKLPDHGFDKQPIAAVAIAAHRAKTPRQQHFDPCKLIIPQTISFHRNALTKKASYESRFR